MHHKAISRRIYPNEQLKSVFEKHFGAVRYVFNHRIAELKEADQNKLRFHKETSLTRLKKTEEFSWSNGLLTKSLQNAEKDFELLASKVFMSRKNRKPVKYHFRSKKNFNSFRMSRQEYKVLDGNIIWLRPKVFGDFTHFELTNFIFPVNCKFYSITISKNNLGHYYISITYEEEKETFKSKTDKDVAIDVGLSALLVTSDNEFISNPRWLRENQLKLTALQKKFSKKKKFSNRWHKYKYKVAKLHHEIANTRKQFYHEITNDLFTRYDTIYVETLSITAMKNGNKSRNKSRIFRRNIVI